MPIRTATIILFILFTTQLTSAQSTTSPAEKPTTKRLPIPDKLVVLTFDDSVKSHYTIVKPILEKHGFGATFYVTDGFRKQKPESYMTWEQIAELHQAGFEIGNHTKDHMGVTDNSVSRLDDQLNYIEQKCKEHGIPKPVTFAWPGNAFTPKAFQILRNHGIQFARRGGKPEYDYKLGAGMGYIPGLDHPLLVPTAGDARPFWNMENFLKALQVAEHDEIAVLQFHGVPDIHHPWVNTVQENFKQFMQHLKDEGYTVIAMRDLNKYIDPNIEPTDWQGVIKDRQAQIATGQPKTESRSPLSEADYQRWLNIALAHNFTPVEIAKALNKSTSQIKQDIKQLNLTPEKARAMFINNDRYTALPYPGGRHPRIGFLDGAIRPRRDTKISIFDPQNPNSYVVVDIPEAIWFIPHGKTNRELLFLAHTHIPTVWDRQSQSIPRQEWTTHKDGSLTITHQLPNKISFGAKVTPKADHVQLEMWINNGSRTTLKGLQTQMCAMLKSLEGFNLQTNDNKTFNKPFATVRNESQNRFLLFAWDRSQRTWGNTHCPCLHSDPQFPDCPPDQKVSLKGILKFQTTKHIDQDINTLHKRFHDFRALY